jgi:hypothetical protein
LRLKEKVGWREKGHREHKNGGKGMMRVLHQTFSIYDNINHAATRLSDSVRERKQRIILLFFTSLYI